MMGDAADKWRAAAEDPSRLVDEIQKLKAELAARDSMPVDNAESIRERLLQPFLGSEAEKLGATKYQLRGGELWECKSPKENEAQWKAFAFAAQPAWVSSLQYRLATGE